MTGAPHVFRVFISSTFSDLALERDALRQRVYPRLRKLCESHGVRFQAVDLRWGVSEQASLDQRTMTICLGEIARCQETTPRPNFLVLLGDRYGWQPLPETIPAHEIALLEPNLSPADQALFHAWYQRDDNAVPPAYLLRPRAGRFEAYDVWAQQVEGPLHHALLQAAEAARLDEEARFKYWASATHQEIAAGALKVADAPAHVFCFFRSIRGLPRGDRAALYRDLDHGKVNRQAQRKLKRLKRQLKRTLPGNICRTTARWHTGELTTGHLDDLCQEVYERLAGVIQAELQRLERDEPLAQEIAAHAQFGADRRRHFSGREEALAAVDRYLEGPARYPLLVTGEPGSGKTAFLAEAADRIRARRPKAAAITRYLGATPTSRNGRLLLESLCRQIARLIGGDEPSIPSDYRELVHELQHLLDLADETHPLVLFIDALDQVSPAAGADELDWLPAVLPSYAHLIVSIASGPGQEELQEQLPSSHVLALRPLGSEDAATLLDRWLASRNRTLQPAQRERLLSIAAANSLPLYLRLIADEAARWRSDDRIPELESDIVGLLTRLFGRLTSEAQHGRVLVARALGYLEASRNGLTEDELLDLLSVDQEVIEDFRRRSPESPASGRLPVVVWSRLRFDLEPYLASQGADGTTTLTFYHPTTFGEAVRATFLPAAERTERHHALAAYFASMPHQRPGQDGRPQPVLRKLAELPYQQASAGMWRDWRETLTDWQFLRTKVAATGPRSLVDDFEERADQVQDGGDLAPLRDAIEISAPVTALDPNQLAGQLAGRLGQGEEALRRSLLTQIDSDLDGPWLRPLLASLAPGSGPLRRTLVGHQGAVRAAAATPDGRRIVSAGDDGTVRIWDLARGEERHFVSLPSERVNDLAIAPDGGTAVAALSGGTLSILDLRRNLISSSLAAQDGPVQAVACTPDGKRAVSGGADGRLRVWDLASGTCLSTMEGHANWVRALAVATDGRRVVSASEDATLRVWDMNTGTLLRTMQGHQDRVHAVALTPDASRAVSGGADQQVILWDLETGKPIQVLGHHGDWIWTAAVSPDGQRAYTGSVDRTVRVWDLATGREIHDLKGHTGTVWSLAVTPDGSRVVSASADGTLKVWDPTRDPAADSVLGHPGWEVLGVAIAPDGCWALSAGGDQVLNVWDIASGKLRKQLAGHTGRVNAVALTPDGKRAVSASADCTLRVWDLASGRTVHTLQAHEGWVNDVAVTPDGRQAVSASHDQSLEIWDLETGRSLRPLIGHTDDVTAVAITPDGEHALSAAWSGELLLWDLARGQRVKRLRGLANGVRTVALIGDDQEAIVGSEDGILRRIDLEGGGVLGEFAGHLGIVWDIAAAPNGRYLFSASEDHTIKAWDLSRGVALATFTGESPIMSCAVGPDGVTLIAGESQSRMHVLRLEA
jgi:WD40 repeat protein